MNMYKVIYINWRDETLGILLNFNDNYVYLWDRPAINRAEAKGCPVNIYVDDYNLVAVHNKLSNFYKGYLKQILKRSDIVEHCHFEPNDSDFERLYKATYLNYRQKGLWLSSCERQLIAAKEIENDKIDISELLEFMCSLH